MCIAEIAVITGSDGKTIPLNEPGTVIVYRRNRGQWQEDREFLFSLEKIGDLAGLRLVMMDLIQFLGMCRTVVAKSASGAVFFELEKARCAIWEISGTPEEFLDLVWQDTKNEQDATALLPEGADIPAPLEISPGCYTISIREIQGKRPELSSKQVLRQFVRQGAFTELEITCDHVPPWIEMEAECRGFSLHSEKLGPNECRVLLVRTSAGPGCC